MNTGQYETIAIDGGFHFFDAYNRIPDLWIGDMDSVQIGKETFRQCKKYCSINGIKVIKLDTHKDDTDMAYALMHAIQKGFREIDIYGGIAGERFDHLLANVQMLHKYSLLTSQISMISERFVMKAIYNTKITFSASHKGIISIFALDEYVNGVTVKGLE